LADNQAVRLFGSAGKTTAAALSLTLNDCALHKYVIWFTVVWQALVFAGLIGRAGQPAHAAGLILGFGWAFIAANVEKLKEPKAGH
jgi:hypothetical protein